ncbi:hypothetical protein [Falsiroseomonas sp.]|uniref:hypothetical protein n=1 Tax=Falsiroseomonas sp. TaxID=2870721 RepID=UPI0027349903|nr:hypothetical protein [Falsiroseomonas sp.]MDP3416131.1 hypothetical protein [Falsiroseomonas sp.]
MGGALALLVLALGAAAAVQAASDIRVARAFLGRTLRSIGLYLGFLAVPLLVLLFADALLPPVPRQQAATGTLLAGLGWLGLAVLLLVRTLPRLPRIPESWLRFGLADVVLLVLLGFGIGRIVGLV